MKQGHLLLHSMFAFVFTLIKINLAYAAFSFRRPTFSQCYLNNETRLIYFPLATNVTKVLNITFFLQEINVKEPLTTLSCNNETTTTNLLNCSVNKDILLGRYNIKRVEANATINQSLIDFPLLSFKDTINYTTPSLEEESNISLSSFNSLINLTVQVTDKTGANVAVVDNTQVLFLLKSSNSEYYFRGVVKGGNSIASFNVNSSNIKPEKYSSFYFDGCQNYINANHTINIHFLAPKTTIPSPQDNSPFDFFVELSAFVNRCNGFLVKNSTATLLNEFICTRNFSISSTIQVNCVLINKDNGVYNYSNMSCDGVVITSLLTNETVLKIENRIVDMSKQATFQKIALTTMFSEPLSIALNGLLISLPQIIARNSTDTVLNNCSIVDSATNTLNCTITDKDLSMSNQPYRIFTFVEPKYEDTGISLLFNIKKNYSNLLNTTKAKCLSFTIIQLFVFIILII